jgi:NADH-quinone oxidoreductase subunit A
VIADYLPLVIYGAILAAIGGAMLGLSHVLPRLLGARKVTARKGEPYECGVPPLEMGARGRFSVKFYLVAILFILFDVETVFLIPWAMRYKTLGVAGLVEVCVFIGILVVALAYVWKRGALEWD